jgi:hypothetical protein
MRKTSAHLAALWILTGANSAVALETAPTGRPAGSAEDKPGAPSPSAPVPVEEAAGSYASPGSAEPASSPSAPRRPSEPAAPRGPPSPRGERPAAASDADGEESEPVIVPARDTVGGHLAVGAIVGLAVPFGSVDSSVAQSDLVGAGLYLGGDITYGVSRTVMVGAYGEVAMPAGQSCMCRPSWSDQNVSVIAAGPMLRYHLVQGTRFDPWLSYGFGFRRVSSGPDSFTGIDWARLQLGGDWYPASRLGLGPLLELSVGTFLDSSGALESKAVNAQFVLGLRVVFDSPGK